MMQKRINELSAKVGKRDVQDRKEHNKILKQMKNGEDDVSEELSQ